MTASSVPPDDDLPADVSEEDMVEEAIPLSILDAIHQLIDERRDLEQFMEQNCARLTEMREQVRAEASAGQQLMETLRAERDAACQQVEALTRELHAAQLDRKLVADELEQVRLQAAHQRAQGGELQRLLDGLREEMARHDRERHGEREQAEQLAKEHADILEMMQEFERMEAEMHAEREALNKEREILNQERRTRSPASPAAPQPAPSSAPTVSLGDPRLLSFACKHCGANLQAKERLAGLVIRCTGCSRMTPVPRQ